jgi:S-adenosylmethionine decarboxylase
MIDRYQMIDVNVYQEKIFHTKMILKDFNLDNYLFDTDKDALTPDERSTIQKQLKQEMSEIFYGRNYRLRR